MNSRDSSDTGTYRLRRIRGYEFEDKVDWNTILYRMGADIESTYDGPPEPPEARCQFCGGRTGLGRDPEYCTACGPYEADSDE